MQKADDYCTVYVDYKADGIPFYVGIGGKKRLGQIKRNRLHTKITNKYAGWYRTLAFGGTRIACKSKEMELIAKFGRIDLGTGTLANFTPGGDGCDGGARLSKEWGRNISLAKKGIPNSPEHNAKISASNMGKPSPNKGKKFSEEIKLKMSIAAKKRWENVQMGATN